VAAANQQDNILSPPKLHGPSTEQVPVSAYVGIWKNLKDLKAAGYSEKQAYMHTTYYPVGNCQTAIRDRALRQTKVTHES
jgi:hypothetical protein